MIPYLYDNVIFSITTKISINSLPDPDQLSRILDPRIWVQEKYLQIGNTGKDSDDDVKSRTHLCRRPWAAGPEPPMVDNTPVDIPDVFFSTTSGLRGLVVLPRRPALLRPLAGYGVRIEAVYYLDTLPGLVCVSSLVFLVKDATQSRQVQ
jgi:hypothetical protein